MTDMNRNEELAVFVVPHYEVHWEADARYPNVNVPAASLTVARDDLQAVLRAVIRTYPTLNEFVSSPAVVQSTSTGRA